MKDFYMKYITCFFIVFSILGLVSGCKRDKIRVSINSEPISQSAEFLAIVAGPSNKKSGKIDHKYKGCFLYVTDLSDKSVQKVADSINCSPTGITWREGKQELYFFRDQYKHYPTILAHDDPVMILGVSKNGFGEKVFERYNIESDFLESISWSPDAERFVGYHTMFDKDKVSQLVVSYDQGENFIKVEDVLVFCSTPPVWADNNFVFVPCKYPAKDKSEELSLGVVKIRLSKESTTIEEKFIGSAKKAWLHGVINDIPVYRLDDDLFHGRKKLLSSSKMLVRTHSDFAAVQYEGKIAVFNKSGELVSQFNIQSNQCLYAIDGLNRFIYIVENFEKILKCNFDKTKQECVFAL